MSVAAGYIERTGLTTSINYYNRYAHQFWRFVTVQTASGESSTEPRRVPADSEHYCVLSVSVRD